MSLLRSIFSNLASAALELQRPPRNTELAIGGVSADSIQLIVEGGPGRGMELRAESSHVVLVGRSQSCDFPVCDPRMSRKHFVAKFSDGRWWICDLGSSNGTQINQQPIVCPMAVRDGDLISAGDTTLQVSLGRLQGQESTFPSTARSDSARPRNPNAAARTIQK